MKIWLLPSFFLLWIGLYFGGSRIANYYRGEASLEWPKTDATVRELNVNVDVSSKGHYQMVALTYDYTVEGGHYTAHRVSFDATQTRKLNNEEATDLMYRVKSRMRGDVLTVSYNPRDPEWSVIFPGHVPFSLGMLGPYVALLGGAVLCGFLGTDRVERRWDELVVKSRMGKL